MKTVKEHPATKEKMLEAALQLMQSKGFPATTIDEICEEAGVTKGGFFHYFADKEQLGKELVEHTVATRRESFVNAPFRQEKDPLKRIYAFIDHAILEFQNKNIQKSCLLGTFAQELSETYPAIRSACEKAFNEWAEVLSKDFDEAKALYLPKLRVESKALAYYFISLIEGSMMLSKVKKNSDVPCDNLKMFKEDVKRVFEK